ncbi:hypothetical protein DFH08DRAFT_797972 [Mycena albidolilacea]|uniref:Uncharacterized protein n=1 Tax=Mycena albidolilacea TaxID=1033008 RepID=A0AAD7ASH5_9AGAR|nr:hypothetical protein DFH08DRAFT_797972 [Mycena albidolilacea]
MCRFFTIAANKIRKQCQRVVYSITGHGTPKGRAPRFFLEGRSPKFDIYRSKHLNGGTRGTSPKNFLGGPGAEIPLAVDMAKMEEARSMGANVDGGQQEGRIPELGGRYRDVCARRLSAQQPREWERWRRNSVEVNMRKCRPEENCRACEGGSRYSPRSDLCNDMMKVAKGDPVDKMPNKGSVVDADVRWESAMRLEDGIGMLPTAEVWIKSCLDTRNPK